MTPTEFPNTGDAVCKKNRKLIVQCLEDIDTIENFLIAMEGCDELDFDPIWQVLCNRSVLGNLRNRMIDCREWNWGFLESLIFRSNLPQRYCSLGCKLDADERQKIKELIQEILEEFLKRQIGQGLLFITSLKVTVEEVRQMSKQDGFEQKLQELLRRIQVETGESRYSIVFEKHAPTAENGVMQYTK